MVDCAVPTLAFCHSETGGDVKGWRASGGAVLSVASCGRDDAADCRRVGEPGATAAIEVSPVGENEFRNGTVQGPSGPFVGFYDPFGECRFSWLNVSLVYNVLPGLELLDKPFAFIASSPFCQERR